jgi:hypothetical protein
MRHISRFKIEITLQHFRDRLGSENRLYDDDISLFSPINKLKTTFEPERAVSYLT